MKDYYKILEVEENATNEDIKRSFRNLSKKYHPDLNPDGAEKFKEINEAYEVLGDERKRADYENKKKNPYGGTQFEDLFSQMFGFGNNPQQNFTQRKNAPDKIIKLSITPIESYRGIQKKITYFRDLRCGHCSGSGGDQQVCESCHGMGFQVRTFGTGFMVQQVRTVCNTCMGKGFSLIRKCVNCDGKGAKSTTNEIFLTIPKGADDGQFFKLANMGDFRGGDYGDLVIQITMTNSDNFEKINNDLVYNLFLDFEGLKNEKFTIPHPDGDLKVPSPQIFDTSKPLRVKGKGFNNGDLYVKLHVRFQRD